MNPLTVRLVLEKVFSHLSLEDLKTCRLISAAWCQESTITMRKCIANIPIGTPGGLRSLISLTQSSHSGIIPFTKFNFSSHFFSLPNSGPTFAQFLSILGPNLESITLTLDKDSVVTETEIETTAFANYYKFPKLTHITFTGHGLDSNKALADGHHHHDVKVPKIFTTLLSSSSSPKIASLSLVMDSDCRLTVQELFRFFRTEGSNSNILRNLESLEIYVPVGNEEILTLGKMGFHLKSLKCDFHRSSFGVESFKSFLNAQSPSLEYLKFDNYYGNSCYTVAFPGEMTRLKTLKIDGRSELSSKEVQFIPFSYTKQFPNLDKLVLGGSIEYNTCWKIFFPEKDTIVSSLKQLKLTARTIDPVWVERAGTIFPCLDKLFFAFNRKNETLSKVLFNSFTNVKELTVYFPPNTGNMDHVFTGMSEWDCARLRENNVGGKKLEGVRDVGLTNLKLLKTLRFKADKVKPAAEDVPHISDVTIMHCLLLMESLQNVTMPPFQISKDAIAKLSAKVNLHLLI